MKIKNFRGVFMRNALPSNGCLYKESAIINLDDKDGPRTHWIIMFFILIVLVICVHPKI